MTTFSDLDKEEAMKSDDRIIAEAKRRFDYAETFEAHTRQIELEDLKFFYGDSNNQWQWPKDIQDRMEKRVRLTINKTRQHGLQIINDAKQKKSSVKITPAGNGATFEAAEAWENIIRHIEYQSMAQSVYGYAKKYQVITGVAYWRIVTRYAHDDTFDQEIFIDPVKDPRSVYCDPQPSDLAGLEKNWAFVFDDMPKDMFDEEYPEYRAIATKNTLNTASASWVRDKTVRVAEYFRRVPEMDKLLSIKMPNGTQKMMKASQLSPELVQQLTADKSTKVRDIVSKRVEWYKIVGDIIIERRTWPGQYIPLVRLLGDEVEIDGRLERSGHTRWLKDPQRMYNYWSSNATEFVAIQGKTPYIAPKKAVESNLNDWRSLNTKNPAVIVYDHLDEEGNEIPRPERNQPPQISQGYIEGMQTAKEEFMMASGQYEENQGQQTNAISGRAINERQRMGENATYHFTDQEGISMTVTGKILLDLVPKVYDVERLIKMQADDGTEFEISIDPNQAKAYFEQRQKDNEVVRKILNPNIGKYSVQADVGPAYATRRQEAFNAITQVLVGNKELVSIIGDLLFRVADFPLADKIAERLERAVPPQLKGEGQDPAAAAAAQHIQVLQGDLSKLIEKNSKLQLELKGKAEMRDIDVYKAITERLHVIADKYHITPKDMSEMLHEVMMEEHKNNLNQVTMANQAEIDQEAQKNAPTGGANE